MPKLYCEIGFAETTETVPGIWEEQIVPYKYYAELNRNNRRLQTSDKVNDDLTISNEISIIADPYARLNFHMMRYVEFMGAKWKITSVDVQYPRLNLTLGGLYNVQQT